MKKLVIAAAALGLATVGPAYAQNRPLEGWSKATLVMKLATQPRVGKLIESFVVDRGTARGQWMCIYDNGNEILMQIGRSCAANAYVG